MTYNELEDEIKEKEWQDSFFKAFSKETDRTIGILAVCYLDTWLEKLIKSAYIKDSRTHTLFKDGQLLRSFYAKINISYFSGLIPKPVYNDLKLINEIRNRFAHEPTAELEFSDTIISRKINSFSQLPPEVIDVYSLKLKFLLIISHTGALIKTIIEVMNEIKLPRPSDIFKAEKQDLQKIILTPTKIYALIHNAKIDGEK